ncbi:hypothetical protein SSX86_013075 [Deinandra increscens subsp. villosa]|uniref:Uncharacterized protein n=1 Tax=Deinandra increscens subsp. villosa TaxID=3103831 RepID=A0AAP0D5T1_9ASTR
MAYRRRQGLSRSSTFKEGVRYPPDNDDATTSSAANIPHTASDSRLDSFRSRGAFHSSFKNRSKGSDSTSLRNTNEPGGGFWGVLARKAKAILEDENPKQSNLRSSVKQRETVSFLTNNQVQNQDGCSKKMDSATLGMQMDRFTHSLSQIGLENRRKEMKNEEKNQDPRMQSAQPQQSNQETKLQTSRDVAIATAAKVKQLMRQLKTVKAELASAEERCCQLEEENKLLLPTHEKRDHPADDDMIRLQLETLLEEKGRLARENSVYAHENRYLREIIDFNQLTMHDLMDEDEDEEVREVTTTTTSPEASQNMVGDSSSSSSRSA